MLTKATEEGVVRVLPIGAVTKGSKGKELAEMGELAEAGVIGFSDDGHPVSDDNIMRQALGYASSLGLPIINHAEVNSLSSGGVMNEGWIATRLGLKGIPNFRRGDHGRKGHRACPISRGDACPYRTRQHCQGTIDLVRRAKDNEHQRHLRGNAASLDAPRRDGHGLPERMRAVRYPHRVRLRLKRKSRSSPALARRRGDDGRQALKEGVIDLIATDHAPHGTVDKQTTFEDAANGISNLETALGSVMGLVHADAVPLPVLIEKLTSSPAGFLGRSDLGTLRAGSPADVTIFDPDWEWVVEPSEFASKGKNTPLAGATLKGQVVATVFGGRVVYRLEAPERSA